MDVVVACSICEEFEVIAERALREVATTEELMEMIDYIEEARTNGMIKLNKRVAVSACSERASFSFGHIPFRRISIHRISNRQNPTPTAPLTPHPNSRRFGIL